MQTQHINFTIDDVKNMIIEPENHADDAALLVSNPQDFKEIVFSLLWLEGMIDSFPNLKYQIVRIFLDDIDYFQDIINDIGTLHLTLKLLNTNTYDIVDQFLQSPAHFSVVVNNWPAFSFLLDKIPDQHHDRMYTLLYKHPFVFTRVINNASILQSVTSLEASNALAAKHKKNFTLLFHFLKSPTDFLNKAIEANHDDIAQMATIIKQVDIRSHDRNIIENLIPIVRTKVFTLLDGQLDTHKSQLLKNLKKLKKALLEVRIPSLKTLTLEYISEKNQYFPNHLTNQLPRELCEDLKLKSICRDLS